MHMGCRSILITENPLLVDLINLTFQVYRFVLEKLAIVGVFQDCPYGKLIQWPRSLRTTPKTQHCSFASKLVSIPKMPLTIALPLAFLESNFSRILSFHAQLPKKQSGQVRLSNVCCCQKTHTQPIHRKSWR